MRVHLHARAATTAFTAALLVATVLARPAWAHAELLETDPASGASVATPLATVTLTFSEPVKQQFSTVVVTGADGLSYGDGTPRSIDRTLRQAVKPLPVGAVRVVWRTVSADGHPLEGQFAFTNAAALPTSAASGPPRAAVPAATASSASAEPVSEQDDSGTGPPWLAIGVALALVVLGGVLWWRRDIGNR